MMRHIKRMMTAVMGTLMVVMPLTTLVVHADAPTYIEYDPGGIGPGATTTGPDGAVWYVVGITRPDGGIATTAINRIDNAGGITSYPIPSPTTNYSTAVISGLAVAADGTAWATLGTQNYIVKLTPASGQVSNYSMQPQGNPNLSRQPYDIVEGPDGAMWFTETNANAIGRVTPDGTITHYPLPHADSLPDRIAKGPDNALWFTEANAGKIGRIAPGGAITEYDIPTADVQPLDITLGPDGAMWFTETGQWYSEVQIEQIARITTSGVVTEFPAPHDPLRSEIDYITTGPDGALWYARGTSHIGRMTTTGEAADYEFPPNTYMGMITGTSDSVWFGTSNPYGVHKIVRAVVATAPAAPANLTAVSPTKQPVLNWSAVAGASSYTVYRGGTVIGTSTTPTYTDTTAPNGTVSYYVTAVGSSGESAPSNTINVVVDTVRPVMNFTAPASFATTFSVGPTITVTASDSGSGIQTMAIHVYTSANQLLTTCGTATPAQVAAGTMSCDLSSLPSGTYYIKAGTFDNAGNNKTINSGNFVISR